MQIEKQKEIIEILYKKLGDSPCPMCGNKSFSFVDGYFRNSVQDDMQNLVIGGKNIPTVAIVCQNCGFVSQHAIGILGLLNEKTEVENDKKE